MGYAKFSVAKESRKSSKGSTKSSRALQTEPSDCRVINDFKDQCRTGQMDGSQALRFAEILSINAFATIYIDRQGHLQFLTSEGLRGRRSELFTTAFCNNFVRICAQGVGDPGVNEAHAYPDDSLWAPEHSSEKDAKRRCSVKPSIPGHGNLSAKEITLWNDFREPGAQGQDPAQFSCESDPESNLEDSETESIDSDTLYEFVKVGDAERIERQVHYLFDRIQQFDCKRIAKAWVKAVEPGKQGKYPYNGGDKAKKLKGSPLLPANPGDLTKPPWWPETGCKHREPDHIGKQERIVLLKHLLLNIAAAKGLTYDKLRASTEEIQGGLKSPAKPLLSEVYDIQRHRERFNRGEIDSDTNINVRFPTGPSRKKKKKEKARLQKSQTEQFEVMERRKGTIPQPTFARSRSPTQSNSPTSPISEAGQVIEEATDSITGISDDDSQLHIYNYAMGHLESNHIPVNASFGSCDSDEWQPQYDDSAISPLTRSSTKEGPRPTPLSFAYNTLAAAQQFTVPEYDAPNRSRLINVDPEEQPEQAHLSYSSGWPLPHSQAIVNRSNLPSDQTQASSMNPLANNPAQIYQPPSRHPPFMQMQAPQSFPMYSERRSSIGYDNQNAMSMRQNQPDYTTHGLPYG